MIKLEIPGAGDICAEHLVLDYNGTLAMDGKLISGTSELLNLLSEKLKVHVITADTFGKACSELNGTGCTLEIIGPDEQQKQKLEFIKALGCDTVIAVGNGANDLLMLTHSALGIAVIQGEGAASCTLLHSDIVVTSIKDALELLLNPLRIAATLRV